MLSDLVFLKSALLLKKLNGRLFGETEKQKMLSQMQILGQHFFVLLRLPCGKLL